MKYIFFWLSMGISCSLPEEVTSVPMPVPGNNSVSSKATILSKTLPNVTDSKCQGEKKLFLFLHCLLTFSPLRTLQMSGAGSLLQIPLHKKE